MELIDLPKEEVALLRFLTTPFHVFCVCDDFEDDRYEQMVLKVIRAKKESGQEGVYMSPEEMLDKMGAWPFVHIKTSKGELRLNLERWRDVAMRKAQRQTYLDCIRICEDIMIHGKGGAPTCFAVLKDRMKELGYEE